jgi:AGCS family alanine or glycine:cation symporter
MGAINDILGTVSNFVWGWPMALILLSAGLLLTLRTLFIQVRGFAHGVAIASGKYDDPENKGELTHFQALSAALSATIGIGNIAGVAIGIYFGGPGAIFWMWVTAAFGMAIKYSECSLAVRYREVEPDGNILGGPMYYIKLGMHRYFRPLAWLFALFTAVAAFGAGNMVQSNTIAHSIVDAFGVEREFTVNASQFRIDKLADWLLSFNATVVEREAAHTEARDRALAELQERLTTLRFTAVEQDGELVFYPEDSLPSGLNGNGEHYRLGIANDPVDLTRVPIIQEGPVGTWRWIIGIIIAALVGTVIIGGIRRIGHVASILVPFMSVVYVLSALIVLLMHIETIIPAFQLIFHHAFNPTAVVGGSAGGATVWMTFTWGLRRGLFSNEAGQGSAAMAHSTAKVDEPVREGLVAMLGPFIDTIVICTMTALVIISTGVWHSGLNGAPLTMHAFDTALPIYGQWMVVVGVLLFAFSTVIAWSYYGEKGIEYIGGKRAKFPYKWVYVMFTLLGARFDLQAVWSYADTANGLMAVPNLIALIVLSGVVVRYTRKYMQEKRSGLQLPFKQKIKDKLNL